MNTDQLKGAWHQLKGEAKKQWGELTDDDLAKIEGSSEKLVGLVQQKYGYARERAEQEVRRFVDRHEHAPHAKRLD